MFELPDGSKLASRSALPWTLVEVTVLLRGFEAAQALGETTQALLARPHKEGLLRIWQRIWYAPRLFRALKKAEGALDQVVRILLPGIPPQALKTMSMRQKADITIWWGERNESSLVDDVFLRGMIAQPGKSANVRL